VAAATVSAAAAADDAVDAGIARCAQLLRRQPHLPTYRRRSRWRSGQAVAGDGGEVPGNSSQLRARAIAA
jgi:hypothetical protein